MELEKLDLEEYERRNIDGAREGDRTPFLAWMLVNDAQTWAVLHPHATNDERMALAAKIATKLAGR